MSSPAIIDILSGNVQTTSTTVTPIITFTTADDRGYHCVAQVVGVSRTSSLGGGYFVTATFKNIGGTVTQVGTSTRVTEHEDDIDWDATMDFSGTTLRVTVAGDVGQTVDWTAKLQVLTSIG